jgi:hypothetical protein
MLKHMTVISALVSLGTSRMSGTVTGMIKTFGLAGGGADSAE